MDSKREKLEELEEQLVLLYRFVAQNNSFKKFYYEGVDVKPSFKDETGILTELISNDDSEEILKSCIIEIEESKQENIDNNTPEKPEFHEILDSYDTEVLYKKYGMSGVEDVDKLDIKKLIGSL
ncbi:MAG: hypothetical protein WCF28_09060 [Methanobacterium sp.]|uniref:hypothetical protein n=1 Tax=Methanobacterium sp. TaxID=2164 RepID=UPI003C768C65